MGSLLRNIRFSLRLLRKRPGVSLLAIVALALGIGANGAVFSAINAILLRPLPFADQERLVMIWKTQPKTASSLVEVSYPELADWRTYAKGFAGLAAVPSAVNKSFLGGVAEPLAIPGTTVSGNFFTVLGVRPEEGRLLLPEDDRTGAGPVIVLSDGLRHRLFGLGKQAVGQRLMLNTKTYTVVGVTPPQFQFPKGADYWVPIVPEIPDQLNDRHTGFLKILGRLRPGVTLEQARQEMDAVLLRGAASGSSSRRCRHSSWAIPARLS
ncbi:MAG: ABC transporter permease [Acidobacteriota bacterium]|nr:ABC transporter permease [Acidobacteriota bacterium]